MSKLIIPDDEEDARINAGIARDADNPELDEADIRAMRGLLDTLLEDSGTGHVAIDADILEHFRRQGGDVTAAINAALRQLTGA